MPIRAALPARIAPVGMVARTAAGMAGVPAAALAATAAELRTSPPGTVKAAVTPGARKRGCAEAVTRHTDRVKAIKPWTMV